MDGIKSGTISLAFRKWNKAAATAGSQIKTSIGLVEIISIKKIAPGKITAADAVKAGYKDLKDLLDTFQKIPTGDIYKIQVRYYAADPRIQLREQTALTTEEITTIKTQLERLDAYSKQGPWTIDILKAIKANPKLRAADLAIKTGKEKDWLKLNIRKLKNIGLTISYEPGYTLSPLGEMILKQYKDPK
ncbi:hypothetical protein [Chitinophaga nivalis]|uniref:ASCH domain-containing protein n=1 Tax=Chitinophaga nivalis TaxID=2991709 RepID=A0ABT3IF25_9BACT|nr:hypothetical protein [Chitinophaga nivalis]MCW3467758.1 hypothetical protein [Chitinophaga nivalis]MCW3482550.1 hypothetical protein [Chitinophaga nivalis]